MSFLPKADIALIGISAVLYSIQLCGTPVVQWEKMFSGKIRFSTQQIPSLQLYYFLWGKTEHYPESLACGKNNLMWLTLMFKDIIHTTKASLSHSYPIDSLCWSLLIIYGAWLQISRTGLLRASHSPWAGCTLLFKYDITKNPGIY